MSRKSDPPALPLRIRVIDGVHCVGTNPGRECHWCGIRFDGAEFCSCPRCALEIADIEQAWRDDLKLWALETLPPVTDTIQ